MAYGTYYRGAEARMGDFVNPRRIMDPNDPRYAGGVNQTQTQPGTVPPPREPGQEGYGFGRNADGSPAMGPDGQPALPPSVNPAPGATAMPSRRSHAYTGSALAYYGTGDIDDTDDFTWGTHATKGFNTNRPKDERGGYTIKNTSGMVFSHYPPKPSSIPLVLADPKFRRLYPNAKQVGFDKIDYGDGKPVDVLEQADPANDSAKAWAFMPESESVPEGAGAGLTAWWAAGNNPPPSPSGTPGETSVSASARTGVTERGYVGPSFRDWVDGDWRAGRGER